MAGCVVGGVCHRRLREPGVSWVAAYSASIRARVSTIVPRRQRAAASASASPSRSSARLSLSVAQSAIVGRGWAFCCSRRRSPALRRGSCQAGDLVARASRELRPSMVVVVRKRPELLQALITVRQLQPTPFHFEEVTPDPWVRLLFGALGGFLRAS
jgi:hypothetical protein